MSCSPLRRGQIRSCRRPRRLRLVLGLVALIGGPLLACMEPDYTSVHFRNDRPDFFRMPQPWKGAREEMRALPPGDEQEERPGLADLSGWENPNRARLIREALRLEAAGQFHRAAAAWARYLRARLAADPSDVADWADPPQVRAVEDRLAALRTWRGRRDTVALRTYLQARDRVSAGRFPQARPLLARLTGEPYRTHAEYLQASLRFYTDTPEPAAAAFRSFLKRHPRHVLALYMLGRSNLRPTLTPEVVPFRRLAPDQRHRFLCQALAAYEACAAADPHGPLAADARGKAAACLYRLGRYPEALAQYCDALAALPPGRDDHFAFLSARLCLRAMTLADHRTFQAQALSRPQRAAVYLDLHLYFGRAGVRASYNLGRFALEVLKRHPAAPLAGRLLGRLAVIEARLGHWERSERLAAAAITRCSSGAYRDQARWQRALALRQLHRPREALAEYERLATGAAVPKMRRGAHEAAAVLSEERGDLANAIRHYFALDYQSDYRYLIDCVASQDDLRAFLWRFPGHPRARLVRYSLGFRQLRAGQYDAAVRTFASLGPWLEVAEKSYPCDTVKHQPRWPPLRLARFLADAARREAAAKSRAEKARLAYGRARLLFRQRFLAFYNGALWKGSRIDTLDLLGPGSEYGMGPLSPLQQRTFDRYQEEHAPLYQALRIFERIARDYPNTPEAPKALYSAALCYDRLDRMDHYWATRKINYAGKVIQFCRRLQREYPTDPLVPAAAQYGGPLPPPAHERAQTAKGARP